MKYVEDLYLSVNEIISHKIIWDNIVKDRYEFQSLRYTELFIIKYENDCIRICAENTAVLYTLFLAKKSSNFMQRIKNVVMHCIIIKNSVLVTKINEEDFIERYTTGGKKMVEKSIKIENLEEEEVSYSDDDLYNITSWGADLSFREILTRYEDGDLLKPELQRKYVWSRVEASRFIDSILLGLPVPSIFFAKEENETMLIIDGYQRIMTVNDYVKGTFTGDGKVFKLSNTENINPRWRGKAFVELEPEEKRKIKNTTIHAIIFEQKHPKNDTGMYQIFERINTGGRTLKPQEIRNCIYQGKCNDLLIELNKNNDWRKIVGLKDEDSRMADIELILRFFAMKDLHFRKEKEHTQVNLTKYLNDYMGDKKNITSEEYNSMKNQFVKMIEFCNEKFSENSFKNIKKGTVEFVKKVNPAIFDAVAVSTIYAIEKNHSFEECNYIEKYINLLNTDEFMDAASNRTTNIENIKKRIKLASNILYGVTYEW
jgi:uncharacterized protein with ParB-like and HNH nuclease domain